MDSPVAEKRGCLPTISRFSWATAQAPFDQVKVCRQVEHAWSARTVSERVPLETVCLFFFNAHDCPSDELTMGDSCMTLVLRVCNYLSLF